MEEINIDKIKKSVESIVMLRKNDSDEKVKDEITRFLEMTLRSGKITQEEFAIMQEQLSYIIENRDSLQQKNKENQEKKKNIERQKEKKALDVQEEKQNIDRQKRNLKKADFKESVKIPEDKMPILDAIIMYKGQIGKVAPKIKNEKENSERE